MATSRHDTSSVHTAGQHRNMTMSGHKVQQNLTHCTISIQKWKEAVFYSCFFIILNLKHIFDLISGRTVYLTLSTDMAVLWTTELFCVCACVCACVWDGMGGRGHGICVRSCMCTTKKQTVHKLINLQFFSI